MIKFYNLKKKKFDIFMLNESELVVDEYLSSYFLNIESIISYIKVKENSKYINELKDIVKEETGIIIMLLLNSSINSYGNEIFEELEFNNEQFNKDFNDLFLGFDNEDIFTSVIKLLYKDLEIIVNSKNHVSIIDMI